MTSKESSRSRVVWGIVGLLVVCVVAGLFWGLPKIAQEKPGTPPSDRQLYQGSESVRAAFAFIDVPQDKVDKLLARVERKGGTPVEGPALSLAKRVFSLRRSRDATLFKSLLSSGTKDVLETPDDGLSMVHAMARQVEEGDFLYGGSDAKFLVTYRELSENERQELETAKTLTFPEAPSASMVFYHYHEPKSMLIGTTFHLVDQGGELRLVFAKRRRTGE